MNRLPSKCFDITLYGILDPEHCGDRDLADLASIAVRNGVTILQYRDKINGTRSMVAAVTSILDAIDDSGVKLIVNDRVDVALACGADGVHLGPCDMDAQQARRILGNDRIIGLSVKSVEGAAAIPADLVDYAFIGGVYETSSKDNPTAIGVGGWCERAAILRKLAPGMPVGAIAGFTAENCADVVKAGADGVATISGIFAREDVAKASQAFRQAIDAAKEEEAHG